jgi:hypothetical protein
VLWLRTSLSTHLYYSLPLTSKFSRWLYTSILEIILEVLLVLSSPIPLVYNRQMNSRPKTTVISAFACRLPNILCTIIRLVFLHQSLTSNSSSYWAARVQGVTQLAIAYTITACVMPYLRPLMQAYENADGSQIRSSNEPKSKLSERSSRGSRRGSVSRTGGRWQEGKRK